MTPSIKKLKNAIPKPLRQFSRELTDAFRFRRDIGRAVPVLVYQMGKVGSSSVYRSLTGQYAGVVGHSHVFCAGHHRPLVRRLYEHVMIKSQPLKVISLTREPVGRNVSAFFQNFERFTGVPFIQSEFSIEELRDIFLKNYDHEIPLTWFDNNILSNFGIDVFSTPFPVNGIGRYQNRNVELLVMRLGITDEEKIAAIQEFLELDRFELININLGAKKFYSQAYRDFAGSIKLPLDYLDQMYSSNYFRHFYSEDRRRALIERWGESVRKVA